MKSILIINSSIRKKTTYNLLKRVESLLGDYDVEFLNIKDFDLKPCVGCENCLRKGDCFLDDEANIILEKISNADGIIIGTPVYLRQISGYLKMLIDRGCAWYHRSPIVGKPIFFLTTTRASGSKQAIAYLKDLSTQWGTIETGYLSRTMFDMEKKLDDNLLKKFKYYLADENKVKYRPSLKQIIEFNTQKVLAVTVLPLDAEYWNEKNYVIMPYFYKCRINIFKRLLGYSYYKFLSYIILKNKREDIE